MPTFDWLGFESAQLTPSYTVTRQIYSVDMVESEPGTYSYNLIVTPEVGADGNTAEITVKMSGTTYEPVGMRGRSYVYSIPFATPETSGPPQMYMLTVTAAGTDGNIWRVDYRITVRMYVA